MYLFIFSKQSAQSDLLFKRVRSGILGPKKESDSNMFKMLA